MNPLWIRHWGSCIDFKIGLIWDVLQCINLQALGIPKCILKLCCRGPTDCLIICIWIKNENQLFCHMTNYPALCQWNVVSEMCIFVKLFLFWLLLPLYCNTACDIIVICGEVGQRSNVVTWCFIFSFKLTYPLTFRLGMGNPLWVPWVPVLAPPLFLSQW